MRSGIALYFVYFMLFIVLGVLFILIVYTIVVTVLTRIGSEKKYESTFTLLMSFYPVITSLM